MTKRHFEAIAEILGECRDREEIIAAFAKWLPQENPRFDAERFQVAVDDYAYSCERLGPGRRRGRTLA